MIVYYQNVRAVAVALSNTQTEIYLLSSCNSNIIIKSKLIRSKF